MEAQELRLASTGVRSITNNINFGLGLKNLVLDQQFAILLGLSHFIFPRNLSCAVCTLVSIHTFLSLENLMCWGDFPRGLMMRLHFEL